MNLSKKILFTAALLFQIVTNAQSAKKPICKVNLVFHTMVGNLPLMFDSNYTTPLGDTFSVTKLKYYISHISLSSANGREEKLPDNYYLIDESDSTSKTISLQVEQNNFTKLNFIIGVDSAKNVNGVQTGALDPANGMFWTWNSGYIMAKLEGKSPQSKAPFGNITYHIGGFREKDNVVRKITLNVNGVNVVNRESSVVSSSLVRNSSYDSRFTSQEIDININVDINKWFNGPLPIKISEEAFCMSPGKMAMAVADNYALMFSIKNMVVK